MKRDDIQAARPIAAQAQPTSRSTSLRIALVSVGASPLAAPGSLGYGGQNVYVAQLARELARAGHLVDVFTRRESSTQYEVLRWADRIRVIHVPAGPARHLPHTELLPYLDAFARFLTRFIERSTRRESGGYDIVHANSFMSGMAAHALKGALGLPFVLRLDSLGRGRAYPIARMHVDTLLRAAGQVLAACPQARHDIEQRFGGPPGIGLAPAGFAPGELWPVPMIEARERLGLDPHRFIVLQLGRMAPRKGVDTVIQGVALLRRRHGVEAELVVVGADLGEALELARLRSLAQDLGIGAQVRFAGQQPRALLRDYYSAANVFTSMPWYEPCGITPLEAMACARPVIGAEVGGIEHTVGDGVTGYLVPPRDPEALAERLARLHRHPELARAMGEAGRRRACEQHTWRHAAAQLLAIYANVLEEQGASLR